jgi:hypothetical protein
MPFLESSIIKANVGDRNQDEGAALLYTRGVGKNRTATLLIRLEKHCLRDLELTESD